MCNAPPARRQNMRAKKLKLVRMTTTKRRQWGRRQRTVSTTVLCLTMLQYFSLSVEKIPKVLKRPTNQMSEHTACITPAGHKRTGSAPSDCLPPGSCTEIMLILLSFVWLVHDRSPLSPIQCTESDSLLAFSTKAFQSCSSLAYQHEWAALSWTGTALWGNQY